MTALSKISSLPRLPNGSGKSELSVKIESYIAIALVRLMAEHPDRSSHVEPVETLRFTRATEPMPVPNPTYSTGTVSWAKSVGIEPVYLMEHLRGWRDALLLDAPSLLPDTRSEQQRLAAVRSAWREAIKNLGLPVEWANPKPK